MEEAGKTKNRGSGHWVQGERSVLVRLREVCVGKGEGKSCDKETMRVLHALQGFRV